MALAWTGREGYCTSRRDGTGRHGTVAQRIPVSVSVAVPFPFPFPFRPCGCAAGALPRPREEGTSEPSSQLSSSTGLRPLLLGGANRLQAGRPRQIYQPPSSEQRQDCRRQRRAGCAMRMRVLPASWSSSSAKHSSGSSDSQEQELELEHPSSSSSSTTTTAAVYLNIYDISPLNHYLYWFGLGIFHSGIEVHGMEYGFGAHEYPTSGVFQVEPKSCPGFIFRRSVCVGTTHMSRSQVHTYMEGLAEDYHGDTYHLIVKNCNHFTADVCKRLTGKPVPGWVNRLARLGSFFNCVLPDSIKVSAVRDVNTHPDFSDDDLGSNASILEGSDDDDLDQLLRTPNSDIVSSRDKTLTPGRDSL